MKNMHSIRLYDFTETPERNGNILFEAALPLANGRALPILIEYDAQTRYFDSCNIELPRGWLTAIKKAAEKPLRDELYRGIEHELFIGAELTAAIPQ